MGFWDLTKQHHGAIYVLKLKYANLIKMNMRERNRARLTLIEVFSVMSVNLRETLCIRSLSASCRSLVFCILTAYSDDGLLEFYTEYSVIRGSVLFP